MVVQSFAESAREDGHKLSAHEAPGHVTASALLGVDAIGESRLHIVSPSVAELGREGEKR